MQDYRIIASDLDGTLLDRDMKISPENWQAIRQLTESGVLFVPASGRAVYEMPREIRECPYVRYLIHSDGAAVYDKKTGESIRLAMSREKSRRMMEIFMEYETDISIRHGGRCYTNAKNHTPEFHIRHRMSRYWWEFVMEYFEPVEDFVEFCDFEDGIEMACVFFRHQHELEEARERFKSIGGYGVAASDPYNIEVFDERAGKGSALLSLADRLGIDRGATIAVGDSANDIDMVTKAGLGLVMANASDELKTVAHQVICSNDEHVVKFIRENYFA